ncbi:MAG TPA: hypothetical protein PKJ86_01975 [Candidatus Dojkabacteria bacterium]|nr:hypothetical protein [Candidatus Dojkabacteria bacterium]
MKKGIFIAIISGVLITGVIGGILLFKYLILPNYSQDKKEDNKTTQEEEQKDSTKSDTNKKSDTNTNSENNKQNNENSTTPKIIITSPEAQTNIDGKFLVTGEALATLQEVTIHVQDDEGTILGQVIAGLASGDPNPIHGIYQQIQLNKSPMTKTGKIVAYPTSEGSDSQDRVEVSIAFEAGSSAERLIVYSPIKEMYYQGGETTIWGQMQDFFEGTGYVKLLNSNGGTLWEGSFTSLSENYNQFANFSYTFDMGQIPLAAGDDAKWVFYDVSMQDGSTSILVEIPVQIH